MYRSFVSLPFGAALMLLLSAIAFGADSPDAMHRSAEQEQGMHHPHEHGGNPLIEEMLKLDGVFRDVVSAVAVGDGHRVHSALEKMHGTMERTHEGVAHGTVTLGKNADRMKEFVAQDRQFHARLEDLAKAAQANNADAMLTVTKDLLDRCVRCHADFRSR